MSLESPATVIAAKDVTRDHYILRRYLEDRVEWVAAARVTTTFGDGTGDIGIELIDGYKFRCDPNSWLIVTGA